MADDVDSNMVAEHEAETDAQHLNRCRNSLRESLRLSTKEREGLQRFFNDLENDWPRAKLYLKYSTSTARGSGEQRLEHFLSFLKSASQRVTKNTRNMLPLYKTLKREAGGGDSDADEDSSDGDAAIFDEELRLRKQKRRLFNSARVLQNDATVKEALDDVKRRQAAAKSATNFRRRVVERAEDYRSLRTTYRCINRSRVFQDYASASTIRSVRKAREAELARETVVRDSSGLREAAVCERPVITGKGLKMGTSRADLDPTLTYGGVLFIGRDAAAFHDARVDPISGPDEAAPGDTSFMDQHHPQPTTGPSGMSSLAPLTVDYRAESESLLLQWQEKGFTTEELLYARTEQQWAASLVPGGCPALVYRCSPDATDIRKDKLMASEASAFKTTRETDWGPGDGGDSSEDVALTQPLFPRGVPTHGGYASCMNDFYRMTERLAPLPGSLVKEFLPPPFYDTPHTNVLALVSDAGADVDKFGAELIEQNRAHRVHRCRQLGTIEAAGLALSPLLHPLRGHSSSNNHASDTAAPPDEGAFPASDSLFFDDPAVENDAVNFGAAPELAAGEGDSCRATSKSESESKLHAVQDDGADGNPAQEKSRAAEIAKDDDAVAADPDADREPKRRLDLQGARAALKKPRGKGKGRAKALAKEKASVAKTSAASTSKTEASSTSASGAPAMASSTIGSNGGRRVRCTISAVRIGSPSAVRSSELHFHCSRGNQTRLLRQQLEKKRLLQLHCAMEPPALGGGDVDAKMGTASLSRSAGSASVAARDDLAGEILGAAMSNSLAYGAADEEMMQREMNETSLYVAGLGPRPRIPSLFAFRSPSRSPSRGLYPIPEEEEVEDEEDDLLGDLNSGGILGTTTASAHRTGALGGGSVGRRGREENVDTIGVGVRVGVAVADQMQSNSSASSSSSSAMNSAAAAPRKRKSVAAGSLANVGEAEGKRRKGEPDEHSGQSVFFQDAPVVREPATQSQDLLQDLLVVHMWCQLHQIHLATGLLVLCVKYVWRQLGDGLRTAMHSLWFACGQWFSLLLPKWVQTRWLTMSPFVSEVLENEQCLKFSITDENFNDHLKKNPQEENRAHFNRARDVVADWRCWAWLRAMAGPLVLLHKIGCRLQTLAALSHSRVKISAYAEHCAKVCVQAVEWDEAMRGFLSATQSRSELHRIGLVLRATLFHSTRRRQAPFRCFPWLNNHLLSPDTTLRRRIATLLLDLSADVLDELSIWLKVNFLGAIIIISMGGVADCVLRSALTSFGFATVPTSQGTESEHSIGSGVRAASHSRAELERVATRKHILHADAFPDFVNFEEIDQLMRSEQDRRFASCAYGRWGTDKTESAMTAAGASRFLSISIRKDTKQEIAMGLKKREGSTILKVSDLSAAEAASGPASSSTGVALDCFPASRPAAGDDFVFEGRSETLRRARRIMVEEKKCDPATRGFIEGPKRLSKGSSHLPLDDSAASSSEKAVELVNFGDYVDLDAMELVVGGLIMPRDPLRQHGDVAPAQPGKKNQFVFVCPHILLYIKPRGPGKKTTKKELAAVSCPRLRPASRDLLSAEQRAAPLSRLEYYQIEWENQTPLSDLIKTAAERQQQSLEKPVTFSVGCEIKVVDFAPKSGGMIIHAPLDNWKDIEVVPKKVIAQRKRKMHDEGDLHVEERPGSEEAARSGRIVYSANYRDYNMDRMIPERQLLLEMRDIYMYFVPQARTWSAVVPKSWRPKLRGTGLTADEKKRCGRTAEKVIGSESIFETTLSEIAAARRLVVSDICTVLNLGPPPEVEEKKEILAAAEMRMFLVARLQCNEGADAKEATSKGAKKDEEAVETDAEGSAYVPALRSDRYANRSSTGTALRATGEAQQIGGPLLHQLDLKSAVLS
eukprot:g8988.t1